MLLLALLLLVGFEAVDESLDDEPPQATKVTSMLQFMTRNS